LELPERIEQRPLPHVQVIDMRTEFVETGRQDLFSRAFEEAVKGRLADGEQIMILLNRRGFSTIVACRKCGHRMECRDCSLALTYHRSERKLLCHYCSYVEPVPSKCPKCDSEYVYFLGTGAEKVEDTLRQRFPKARIARLDRDSVRGRDHYETVLNAFREKSYDILVGTQMIAKGHDIPNVTFVGVVSADVGLGIPDFRAAERTFQLLTQVAGRAGRGHRPGQVLLQTLNTDHYAIRFAAAHDYEGFYRKELHFRRMMHYPPFTAMASLLVRSKKLEEALTLSGKLGRHLHDLPEGIRMLGPAAAPVVRLKTDYRYQFLLKAVSRRVLAQVLRKARDYALGQNWPATALVMDVDPMSLM
jgi:primosomal protein N' (replication factor Y)